jgi:hypothetical protein
MKIPQDYLSYFAGFGPRARDLSIDLGCTISVWSPNRVEQQMKERSNHELYRMPPGYIQFANSEWFAYAFNEHGAVFAFMNLNRDAYPPSPAADNWNEFIERMHGTENLVLFSMPSLLWVLNHHEKLKGGPLTEIDVNRIASHRRWVGIPIDNAPRIEAFRGYQDIDPDHCWEEWQAARSHLADYKTIND